MGRIIVVEDNIIYSDFVCRLLESKGYPSVSTFTCNGARKLFAKMREDDIILADLRLNDGDGISLLEELRKQGRNNPYIVMTDYDEVPTAVRSMKQGAEDYIPKKLIETNLFPLLKTLRKRMERHDTPIHERQSAAFREIDRKIRLVAPTNMSVLILGESGTGKEHIAEKIHTMSKRAGKPFVAVDCGLLPVRTRERGVHGSGKQEARLLGGSRRRHAVPRRDRQPATRSAADAAPRIGSQTVQAHGRQQGQAGRRAYHRRHQRGPAGRHRRKAFPSGFVPSDKGIHIEHTAAARVP